MLSLLVLCILVASTYAFTLDKTAIDPAVNWRIFGGSDAPDGEYPHQISLKYYRSHTCGGAIIDKEWVITAAHCVERTSVKNLQVHAGSNKLNTGGVLYQVLEVHMHEFYDDPSGLNDTAILKVEKMTFNDKVNKIAVEKGDVGGDVPVILSGWGSNGTVYPDDLQHIRLKTTTVQQCKDAHAGGKFTVDETTICSLTKAGEGACYGDSGSALITYENGSRKVVGLANWVTVCARGKPDVYARVSSFFDWYNGKCNCL